MADRLGRALRLIADERAACASALDESQSILLSLQQEPALEILVPMGKAQLADLDYQLHLARGHCTKDRGEIQAAADAARRAVEFYRDALDYESMALMQFNLAVTVRELGDEPRSIALLDQAIDMDREFAFSDEAESNLRLARLWRGRADAAPEIAAVTKDFPKRIARFEFKWSQRPSDVVVTTDWSDIVDGRTIRSENAAALKRVITEAWDAWIVKHEFGAAPLTAPIAAAPERKLHTDPELLFSDLRIDRDGNLVRTMNSEAFAERLSERARPSRDAGPVIDAMAPGFTRQFVQAKAAEFYDLVTATWIGARLAQGVWYDMTANLLMPGTHFAVLYETEFAFTRMVPCAAEDPERRCAEIVLHAAPDLRQVETFKDAVARAGFDPRATSQFHYRAFTDLRLVVDPATLEPHLFELRNRWYLATGDAARPVIQSERIIANFIYR